MSAGNSSEREHTRQLIQPGGFYVCDRGYVDYDLFAQRPALPWSFIVRVQNKAAYEVAHERVVSAATRAAGGTRDVVLECLGPAPHRPWAARPLRVVRVTTDKQHRDGTPMALVRVTHRGDLDAELVALAARYRWAVALGFRWFKCILGCRHLLSRSENGVQVQVYMALIASLLISLWVGPAPTKRTYEMLCFYLNGWASTREVITHLARVYLAAPPRKK